MSSIQRIYGTHDYVGFKLGIEFEIESYQEVYMDKFPVCLHFHEENSLRNLGAELVTDPCTFAQALEIHNLIFHGGGVKFECKNQACSERGSIHVHVNFADRTEEEAKTFIRYYYLLEPLFFSLVDSTRQNNIYCVPLSATHMLKYVLNNKSINYMCENWHKYTALNAKPLTNFGTIEFRHLQATDSHETFKRWLTSIQNLYNFVINVREPLLFNKAFMLSLSRTIFPWFEPTAEQQERMLENLTDDLLYTLNPTRDVLTSRIKEKREA